ncbi:AEC family transporter [Sulfuricurvum sp. IAE1]|jgi:predicted permease|uniref:AEC family transporter n=1 Tax=Sulfuricurvum sp. IAE1 TaxID=2546102 RepID=UPI0010455E4F|nr:AEC family transporter [Sulfuricurvum sp. IAE1]MDD3769833.1 AEC family transporter [Sulfuricurvum sp.]MDX9965806.1 AEC family transporter [Sulfuricurvum sp.]TDA62394.1 AEC family transporter [Sulfuricurvum sp. IAE1]
MEQFAFIVALLLIGMALQRADAPADFSKSLNFFVIYVSLPATVLLQVPKIDFDLSALGIVLVPWLLLPITAAIVVLMTRNQPLHVRAALLLVIPLGNTSFVGIPIVQTLLGDNAIPYVLMYDQFGTFLMLSLYGSAVIARYESGVFHKRLILKKLLLFPPFLILLFALGWGEMPAQSQPYLQILSSTLVPLALVSVGYSLKLRGEVDYPLFAKALALKLLLMPLIAFGILRLMGADFLALQTGVLESGMPSMITAGALAIAAGFAPALSAALVGYGILVSLVTLPMIAYLMETVR